MGGFTSLSIVVSSLNAARAGLNTTGHNIANADTVGFTRQQVIQNDFMYKTIGQNSTSKMQIGLGTDISQIRQIRDKYLDVSYRKELPKLGFYTQKLNTYNQIESIIGELEGEYNFQSVLNDLYNSLNELSINPEGLQTRQIFMSNCSVFVDKINNVGERLVEEQNNLNEQIKSDVKHINNLLNEINDMNQKIAFEESSGDNANDFRDRRAVALDELAVLIPISYREMADKTVVINCEGKELISNSGVTKIGLRYTFPKQDFVEPVITNSQDILEYDPEDAKAIPLFNMATKGMYYKTVDAKSKSDDGKLKGAILARGLNRANYTDTPKEIQKNIDEQTTIINNPISTTTEIEEAKYSLAAYQKQYFNAINCIIPKTQIEFDTLVNSLITMINDVTSPKDTTLKAKAPFGIDQEKSQFVPIFVRGNNINTIKRYDQFGVLIDENKNEPSSLYTIGNIVLNPEIVGAKNYDKIPLSYNGDIGHQKSILDMLDKWANGWQDEIGTKIKIDDNEPKGVDAYYRRFITGIATSANETMTNLNAQQERILALDNKRKQISEVSMDEEMKNILIYQHAYNASARMVSVIDSMIDKIVNGIGR